MISALPGQPFTAVLDGAAPNLVGTLTVAVRLLDGTIVAAATAAPVHEIVVDGVHTGSYTATLPGEPTEGQYQIVWDDGTGLGPYLDDLLVEDPVEVVADSSWALPDQPFALALTGVATGLAGTLTVALLSDPATVIVEPTAATIAETAPGSYTAILEAPDQDGSYLAVWHDAAAYYTDPVIVADAIPGVDTAGPSWEPTVADVGDLLRIRTRDSNGNTLGTFTADTSPTGDQVERLIDKAVTKVTSKIGVSIPAALEEKAGTVVALRAAMLVELSYFGDQIAAQRSPFNELKTLHDEEWKDLYSDWRDLGADLLPGTADDTSDAGMPVYSFPPLGGSVHAPGSELPADLREPIW